MNNSLLNRPFKLNNIILNFNNAKNGGAIYLTSNAGFTNIINCNFTKNQGSGSAFSISANNVTIDKCIFKENIGIGYGAIDTNSGSDGLIVKNSEFYNNTATGDSGALLFASTSSNMLGYNLTFINNSAKNGGACRISGNNNAIVNSTFKNNKATDKGGAIYLYTGSYITIDDCVLNNSLLNIPFKLKLFDFYSQGLFLLAYFKFNHSSKSIKSSFLFDLTYSSYSFASENI